MPHVQSLLIQQSQFVPDSARHLGAGPHAQRYIAPELPGLAAVSPCKVFGN